MRKVVSVVGGGGHVGLPLCLVLANHDYQVYGIEVRESVNKAVMEGKLPFAEEDGEEYLRDTLQKASLVMTSDASKIKESDIIIIALGTPVDVNLNPNISDITKMLEDNAPFFREGQLIILRSTLFPGATQFIAYLLEKNSSLQVGRNLFLAYAPERVMQGRVIKELETIPQIIGAFDDKSYKLAEEFFSSFIRDKCFKLTPIEAELGKLFSNMARYVEFALANELYLIAETFGANMHRIIEAINYNYVRQKVSVPGPNVGGPCLYKDGWFLLERLPFSGLISSAFRVNEGMPMQIVTKLEKFPHIRKVAILGLAFKPGSDDVRNSLSFKLKNQLERRGYSLVLIDPYLENYKEMETLQGSDAVILMTPHKEFSGLEQIMELVGNPECLYVDIWGLWERMRYKSQNGYFWGKEAILEYSGRG